MFASTTSYFPLALTAVRGELDDGDVERIRAFYEQLYARGRFVNMCDTRGAKRPNSLVRQKLAAVTSALLPQTKTFQAANAVVLDGPLTTGVMTALRWAIPAPAPERYFSSIEGGLEWLEGEATRAGLVITAEARAAVLLLARDAFMPLHGPPFRDVGG